MRKKISSYNTVLQLKLLFFKGKNSCVNKLCEFSQMPQMFPEALLAEAHTDSQYVISCKIWEDIWEVSWEKCVLG